MHACMQVLLHACSRGMMIQKIRSLCRQLDHKKLILQTFQLDAYIDEKLGLEHIIRRNVGKLSSCDQVFFKENLASIISPCHAFDRAPS